MEIESVSSGDRYLVPYRPLAANCASKLSCLMPAGCYLVQAWTLVQPHLKAPRAQLSLPQAEYHLLSDMADD